MALFRHVSTVALLTLASRVLGFLRDAMVAALFGTGVVAEAAVAGLALPQLARRLLGEGALNAAIVPRLGPDAGPQRAGAALLLFMTAATLLAVVAFVFMGDLVALMVPGFPSDGPREAGAVLVGRLAVICLPLMAAAGVLAALINISGHVTRPALSPVLGNVAVIAVILGLMLSGAVQQGSDRVNLAWLAGATVAGAVMQLLVMLLALPKGQVTLRVPFAACRAAVPMLVAAGPALFSAALPQLRFLIAAAAASSLGGGVAALFFATRLVELPLGLVGASAGAVLLPAMVAGGREAEEVGARSIEAALALALPAAFGLAVLAHPIVSVLLQRGAFDPAATELTATAVAFLALTLPLLAVEKILTAMAFAHGSGSRVVRINFVALPAGALVGFAAAGPLGIAGPALGVLAASVLGVAGLALAMKRTGRLQLDRTVRRRLFVLGIAALSMALFVALAARVLAEPLGDGGFGAVLALGGMVALGVGVYGGIAIGLGALRLPGRPS